MEKGLGFRVKGLGFSFRVRGSGFRVNRRSSTLRSRKQATSGGRGCGESPAGGAIRSLFCFTVQRLRACRRFQDILWEDKYRVTFTIALLPFVSVSLVNHVVLCSLHGNFIAFPNAAQLRVWT